MIIIIKARITGI